MRNKVVLVLVVGIVLAGAMVRSFRNSLFYGSHERVNVAFYREYPVVFSLGNVDNLHYAIEYYPDMSVQVPGGYGAYRIGALGKLVSLEKNPKLVTKTFSVLSGSFIDLAFIPKSSDVYYGKEKRQITLPSIGEIFTDSSSANILDRLYIFFHFFGKRSQDFTTISTDNTQGYFYQNHFRNDRKNVQIRFSKSSATALGISTVLEGNGIRVADITQERQGHCTVVENKKTPSETAQRISEFFQCPISVGETGVYDILFTLGEREKEWEIN